MPRPTALTRELLEEFRKRMVTGAFQDEVAQSLGYARQTPSTWKRKGYAAQAKADAGEELTPTEQLYSDFAHMVETARGEAIVYAHGRVREHMRTNWRACIWYLAIVDPQRYASRTAREQELPTPEQVARDAVAEVGGADEDVDGVVRSIEQYLEQRKRQREQEEGTVEASTGQPEGDEQEGAGGGA